jgi:hypothetical protein
MYSLPYPTLLSLVGKLGSTWFINRDFLEIFFVFRRVISGNEKGMTQSACYRMNVYTL